MITISENELQGLVNYLQEQPAKFSNPLLNFFETKIQEVRAKQGTDVAAPTQDQINNMDVVAQKVKTPKPPKRPNVRKLENNA